MDLSLFESATFKKKNSASKTSSRQKIISPLSETQKLEKYSTEDEQLLSGQQSPQT